MKKTLLCLMAGLCVSTAFAETVDSDADELKKDKKEFFESMSEGKSVFQAVTGYNQKQDYLHLYMNMHAGYDAMFQDGFQQGKFNIRQIRIEAKGNLNSWLSYRYRQRLNRSNDGSGGFDNTSTSIDIAGIGVKLSDKWSLFAGKQCASYGGIEFDLNPIEIYEYSDMIENMSNFLTGLNIAYQVTPSQQLQFQVLNSRNYSIEKTYGNNVEDAKMPLVYTLNWNGNFSDVFKTRWSASIMNEARGNRMYYLAFGNELNLGKVNGFFDVMYSNEGLDRKGMLTNIIGDVNGHNANDARYLSLVTKWNYRFNPKWNIFVKGMYETASAGKQLTADSGDIVEKGKYRTSLGYFAGLEYYPMESNLHFYLTYVGRSYKFEDRAKAFGFDDYSTNRISVGFIYQLPVF